MARSARLYSLFLAACLVSASAAQAQKEEEFSLDDESDTQADALEKKPSEGVPAGDEEDKEKVLITDEQALEEERMPQEEYRKSTDPYEDPDENYFFVGANWRYLRMPSWILEWGLDSAPSIGSTGSFFAEFAYRKDGFQVAADVGWMKFHLKGPFTLAGDPDEDTEWLDGPFNLLVATATITWSTSFTDWMSLDYGIETGPIFVFGELTRSEAYRDRNGDWRSCPGYVGSDALPVATDPGQGGGYCAEPLPDPQTGQVPETNAEGEDGEHYGVKAKKGVFNKGVPNMLWAVGPKISLRFKPIKQLVLRVDVPLPVFPFGFTGGIAALFGF
jgi:hypothetical protein